MTIVKEVVDRIIAKWFVCRITSGKKSAQYGIRFSYPLYITIVAMGTFLENPYVLSITALIAFFGVVLPMHPFDYVYNYVVAKLLGSGRIPGRGSELQVNSCVALLFSLLVTALIVYGFRLNYGLMALIYIICSAFFVGIHLLTDNFSLYSFFPKKSK